MTAVPLLSGIKAAKGAELEPSYPLNLEPVVVDSGLSRGQLRMTSGAVQTHTGPGTDRGGIVWNGAMFRVMGTKLVRIDQFGALSVIGDVGGEGPVTLDYSFGHLGIRSSRTWWLYDGLTLAQVTDPDLGQVVDAMWIDGYWMFTDGTYIPVAELNDPFQIKPLKYGSAEEDPDPITGLMKDRRTSSPYWLGRFTIQAGRNVGGNGFPFAAQKGATIPYGCVSATAKAYIADTFAFVGGARNQALAVWIAGQADAQRISTRPIEDALAAEPNPEGIVLETRASREEERLFVHLTAETWVFLVKASAAAQTPIWYRAQSAAGQPYRLRSAVEWSGRFVVGDLNSGALGDLSDDVSSHFGEATQWQFQTGILYGEGRPALLKTAELVGLPGRGPAEPTTAFMSMTRDGTTWSIERGIPAGTAGQRTKRVQWRPNSRFSNYIGMRFRGYDRALPGFARLECEIEGI